MTDYKLTREEQETIIGGNAASQTWNVCTADPRIIRRMERQGYKPETRANPWGYVSFTVPFDRVRIAKREKSKRGFATKKTVALHNNAVSETDTPISISQ